MAAIEFRAMNTTVLVAAEDSHLVSRGLSTVRDYIAQAERRFSRFIPQSELCHLNNSAGTWTPVSPEMMEILMLACRYYEETHGLFDPSILPELAPAGYDKSMDQIVGAAGGGASSGVLPTEPAGRGVSQGRDRRAAFSEVELEATGLRARLPAGMAVDLGGIAKGWIVQQAAMLLSSFSTPCAVSAGGDMYFVGVPDDGSRWQVELEDPRDPRRTLAWLRTGPGAVVTSSVTKRAWSKNSVFNHHIIDPRTGKSAKTDWLSATVIARDAVAAEAYAKALLIGGRDEAIRLQQQSEELAFVNVEEDGALFWSPNFKDFIDDDAAIPDYSKI